MNNVLVSRGWKKMERKKKTQHCVIFTYRGTGREWLQTYQPKARLWAPGQQHPSALQTFTAACSFISPRFTKQKKKKSEGRSLRSWLKLAVFSGSHRTSFKPSVSLISPPFKALLRSPCCTSDASVLSPFGHADRCEGGAARKLARSCQESFWAKHTCCGPSSLKGFLQQQASASYKLWGLPAFGHGWDAASTTPILPYRSHSLQLSWETASGRGLNKSWVPNIWPAL